jgi:hypothetical protein
VQHATAPRRSRFEDGSEPLRELGNDDGGHVAHTALGSDTGAANIPTSMSTTLPTGP